MEDRKKIGQNNKWCFYIKKKKTQKRRRSCVQEYIYIYNGIYREFSIVRKLCMLCYFIQINKGVDMNKTQVAYFVKKFIVILSKEIDKNKYTIVFI